MLDTIEAGQCVEGTWLVSDVRPGTTRRGSAFLTLQVQDRSARLAAKIWEPQALCPDGIDAPAPYRIRARVESYREELQLNIEAIAPATPSPEELEALVPSSRWSAAELERAIREHLDTHVRQPALRRIVEAFLRDPEIVPRFWEVPAAAANHHAYRCGLAEHTLSMLRVATLLQAHYEAYYPGLLQKDLLLTGVLLHDMGKVWEFADELVARYSTAGRLVGHIPMMAVRIERTCRELGDIPDGLIHELQHLVLAHHGEYEYGSPRRPKTAEAQLLHNIDMMDARLAMFQDAGPDPGWTSFHRALGRPLLVGGSERDAWLADLPEGQASAPTAESAPKKPAAATAESAPRRAATADAENAPRKTATADAESAPRKAGRAAAPAAARGEGGSPAAAESEEVDRLTLSLFGEGGGSAP